MKTREIAVKTIEGIDARYAADIAALVRKFKIEFALMEYKGNEYNLKSVLSIVSAQVVYGGAIVVKTEGEQCVELLDAIENFFGGLGSA